MPPPCMCPRHFGEPGRCTCVCEGHDALFSRDMVTLRKAIRSRDREIRDLRERVKKLERERR